MYIYIACKSMKIMKPDKKFKPDLKLKLKDQARQVLCYHHYSYRTEKTYCDWILRYIKFNGAKKHPRNMGKSEIEAFLSHLAVRGNVSASTQWQTLNAIIFLYRDVIGNIVHGIAGISNKYSSTHSYCACFSINFLALNSMPQG